MIPEHPGGKVFLDDDLHKEAVILDGREAVDAILNDGPPIFHILSGHKARHHAAADFRPPSAPLFIRLPID